MPAEPAEELTRLWHRVRGELASSVPRSTFELWLEPLRVVSAQGSTLYVTAPATVRSWAERRYAGRLVEALVHNTAGLDSIAFVPGGDDPTSVDQASIPSSLPFDPAHTFARFVIGSGNRLAHAAALAVAELPGDAYNPLFLHGPPGLGKTHLLGAIASYMQDNHTELTVHYTTAERFTTEFVTALRNEGPQRFKARYRELDALLIDDVQILEGKQRTEEEFVHTFNALHAAGKQIVLSSDRPPQSLARLEGRLRDRLQWGLCATLDPPDLRTRIALLWRLASAASLDVPEPSLLREVAVRLPTNVRLLEGTMTRILALTSMLGEPLAPAVVDRALQATPSLSSPASPDVTIAAIQDAVCSVLDVSRADLLSPRRSPRVARARQLAMYTARELTSHSLTEIAHAFGRDHTTVGHAVRRVAQSLEPGSETAVALGRIRSSLGSIPRPSDEPPGLSPQANP